MPVKKKTREVSAPASRVIASKVAARLADAEVKVAKTPQDWLIQERAEGPIKERFPDVYNEALQRNICVLDAGSSEWRMPTGVQGLPGNMFKVFRLYPHAPAVIIDLPGTEHEMQGKAQYFQDKAITYVAVAPGESMLPEDLRARVNAALELKFKHLSVKA